MDPSDPALPQPPALGRSFFARDAEEVARDLLGARLCREVDGRLLEARIVETEAYVGAHDRACHASKGRTARTEVMFGPPGYAYVYFVYGMHHMLNAVTAAAGDAQAVLIRAAEPLSGLRARLDGPGRLTAALSITLADNGADLCAPPLWIAPGRPVRSVGVGRRIGVDYAGAWALAPLRFFDADSPHVSRRAVRGRGMGTSA